MKKQDVRSIKLLKTTSLSSGLDARKMLLTLVDFSSLTSRHPVLLHKQMLPVLYEIAVSRVLLLTSLQISSKSSVYASRIALCLKIVTL